MSPEVPALKGVNRFLEDEARGGAFPGGVLAIVHGDALVHLHPFGRLSRLEGAPPVVADSIYDIASLTKIVATTTVAMTLVDEGLDLAAPVSSVIPGFWSDVRILDLLAHSSGLPATRPLYQTLEGHQAYLQAIAALPREYAPASKSVYSDLGFIVLGALLERVSAKEWVSLVTDRVLDPLRLEETRYLPPAGWRGRIAPTEDDPWRGRLLQGEVHDENASALGGAAPHAGLFATASDLARFARMILGGGELEGARIVSAQTVSRFLKNAGIPGSSRALGWDTKSPGSSAGERLTSRAIGHTGFTGTSIWIDPSLDLGIVLLTNRVHPHRDNTRIFEVRRQVADQVVGGLSA